MCRAESQRTYRHLDRRWRGRRCRGALLKSKCEHTHSAGEVPTAKTLALVNSSESRLPPCTQVMLPQVSEKRAEIWFFSARNTFRTTRKDVELFYESWNKAAREVKLLSQRHRGLLSRDAVETNSRDVKVSGYLHYQESHGASMFLHTVGSL